jgi:hypothetical protein
VNYPDRFEVVKGYVLMTYRFRDIDSIAARSMESKLMGRGSENLVNEI